MFSTIYGFAALRRDGLITLPGDPDETVRRMVRVFSEQLERERARQGEHAPA